MNRIRHIYVILLTLFVIGSARAAVTIEKTAHTIGQPFVANFSPQTYDAHSRNFDIIADGEGRIYVANFEALLYYDGALWRKLYTPGISRITEVERDSDGRIWVSGFNYLGYLINDARGCLHLKTIISDIKPKIKIGEPNGMLPLKDRVYIRNTQGQQFCYNRLTNRISPSNAKVKYDKKQSISLADSTIAVNILAEGGLRINDNGFTHTMMESDGLCSNSINAIAFDGRHTVWGATNNGIFAIELPSPYSHITEAQGLKGVVYCINNIGNTIYVGSLQGLYRINGTKAELITPNNSACWELLHDGPDILYAATSEGLVKVTQNSVKRLTSTNTTFLEFNGYYIFTSEIDGTYRMKTDGSDRRKISNIGSAIDMYTDGHTIIMETINGETWKIHMDGGHDDVLISDNPDKLKHDLTTEDDYGRTWTTSIDGTGLIYSSKERVNFDFVKWIRPFSKMVVNDCDCPTKDCIIVGGSFGIIACNTALGNRFHFDKKKKTTRPELFIREIALGDSTIWGGYEGVDMEATSKVKDISLKHNCGMVTIYFSTDDESILMPTRFRYRINGGEWSEWSDKEMANFSDIPYGRSAVEIQAYDLFSEESEIARVEWTKDYPPYLRWYAILFYVAALIYISSMVNAWRTRKLTKAKMKLEKTVSERTAELSNALTNLKKTQADLVRMERTATAGKLTQGLIDRILNPINYINNFAKLTTGLASDLAEDIEDEKENMSEDNYEDCDDILKMMKQNLGKIEEHGVNTTRMLRAMEAMLNTQIKTLRDTDLNAVCRQAVNVATEYHKDQLAQLGIAVKTDIPQQTITKPLDGEAFCTMLMSIVTNAVYAVAKRKQQSPQDADYKPEVNISLITKADGLAVITVTDNGIGIEETIREKVFDPFFTTKTTSEAAGVGLYLAREIVQAHNGTIVLNADTPGETTFVIKL